ncbi:hypothetical protein F4774DRAFT_334339 [Daldinia eschscholtzii]|nr:hypothetical protein F4774DRAFT_334339 [Daldinia eschscholtzii]
MILVYRFGHHLRRWSKFAQTLAEAEAEAEVGVGIELNTAYFDSGISTTAVVNSDRGDGGEDSITGHLGVDRIVHFLTSESLPGSRAGSRYASAANTPVATRPASLDLEHLGRSQLHGQHIGQHSQARPASAPGRSPNVSPVPEAGSSDDVSKTCTNCSGQTLAGTCTQCSRKSTRAPNSENESPPTSLREVENAELNATPEPSAAIAAPTENRSGTLPTTQQKAKKRPHSGDCRVM